MVVLRFRSILQQEQMVVRARYGVLQGALVIGQVSSQEGGCARRVGTCQVGNESTCKRRHKHLEVALAMETAPCNSLLVVIHLACSKPARPLEVHARVVASAPSGIGGALWRSVALSLAQPPPYPPLLATAVPWPCRWPG